MGKLNVKCPTRALLVSSQHRTAPNKAADPRRPPAPGSPSTRRDSRSTTTSPTRSSSSCVSYHPRPLSDSSMSAPHQSDGSMKSVAIMTRPFNSRHTTTMSSAMLQMSNDSLFKTLARLAIRTDVLKFISILAMLTFSQLRTLEHLILVTRARNSVSQSNPFVSMVKLHNAPDKTTLYMDF